MPTLHIHHENGDQPEATSEDLNRHGWVPRTDAYAQFRDHLGKALIDAGLITRQQDLDDSYLAPVVYLAEVAIRLPDMLDTAAMRATYEQVADIERALRARNGGGS